MSPSKPMIERARRGAYDELYTPAGALTHLLPYIPKGIIWESAPGSKQLVKLLKRAGHNVIYAEKDFFTWEPSKWDLMVTNPPFSLKAKWLHRANELGKPYALLLPVTALGSRNCQVELMKGNKILFLPKRIDFTGKKAPWFAVAWFCCGLGLPRQLNFVSQKEQEE